MRSSTKVVTCTDQLPDNDDVPVHVGCKQANNVDRFSKRTAGLMVLVRPSPNLLILVSNGRFRWSIYQKSTVQIRVKTCGRFCDWAVASSTSKFCKTDRLDFDIREV